MRVLTVRAIAVARSASAFAGTGNKEFQLIKTYNYMASGTAADQQKWWTEGQVTCEFHEAFNAAIGHSFMQLTRGRARYNNPGKFGCKGPYEVQRVLIKLVESKDA